MRVTAPRILGAGLVAAVGWAALEVSGSAAVPGVSASVPGVPQVAVDAYINAARSADVECGLSWSLLAGIGAVESGHGTFGSSMPDSSGLVSPPIRGPRLDGVEFANIPDTDGGRYDGDTEYDRAVGPMQFIPATWEVYGEGGNPQNINDAAKATANLLCSVSANEDKPLTDPAVEEAAIRAYNNSGEYVDAVRAFAGDFAGIATGPAPGGKVDAKAVAERLGSEGKARWGVLGRRIDAAPGTGLDTVYGLVDPLAGVVWNTLGSDSSTVAAAVNATEGITTAVGGDARIEVDASIASQVAHLLSDAKDDGVVLKGSGYRTSERQAELRVINGCPDMTSPSSTCDVLTAPVGSSMHEKGLAVDFTDEHGVSLTEGSPGFLWLEANASKYGLHNLIGGQEPWHWSSTGR